MTPFIQHPFAMTLSGPSGAGKTFFVKKFLKFATELCDTKFERILLYYSEWQETHKKLGENIEFHEGLPQNSDYSNDSRPKLIIIDDLMRESSNKTILDLFTKGSHHKNLSIIFITQNLFHQGSGQRDISLNTNYIVLFKNPRDRAQIQYLSRQVCPESPKFLQEVFFDATLKPHGYLFLDLKQSTPENCRYRTNIFPDDEYKYVYISRNNIKSYDTENLVPVFHQ